MIGDSSHLRAMGTMGALGALAALIAAFPHNTHAQGQSGPTNLPPLSASIGVWGDYDNDGLMDVMLAGTAQGVAGIPDGRFTRLYHNEGSGLFKEIGAALPQLAFVAAAWGDFDNDGDPDLLLSGAADGTNGSFGVMEIFRNDGSNHFSAVQAGLEGLAQGTVAWVDYDNDGALDVFVTGLRVGTSTWATRLYRNNGAGTFSPAPVDLPALTNGRGYWSDYDNDGDADLVLGGAETPQLIRNDGRGALTNLGFAFLGGSSVASAWGDYDGNGGLDFFSSDCFPCAPPRLYQNDGSGVLSGYLQSPINMWVATAAWGDIDNSGRASVLVSGWVPLMQGVWGIANRVYLYQETGWQEVVTLGGRTDGSVAWVDFDGDGDLDIFYTGQQLTAFWTNTVALRPDVPLPPGNLAVTFAALDEVMLSWEAPSNLPPTGRGLSYNLRVGRTLGGVEVVSPLADAATGSRLVHALGNAGAAKRWKLIDLWPGTYHWSVQSISQNYAGSPFAAEGVFTVTSSPPSVVVQPVDVSVYAGSNAAFAVIANGSKPLAYQWRKDGANLTNDASFLGTTASVLTITNAQPRHAGLYEVVVSNDYGSITSAVAALAVRGEPRIIIQPTNQYVAATWDANFAITAAGGTPLSYQWYSGGVPRSGATSPTLVLPNVQAGDAGNYWVVVSNEWGMVTSSVVTVTLATVRYVNVSNSTPVSPYTNWTTAATNIQAAINVAGPGDQILVTNGVYRAGDFAGPSGYAPSRIGLNKPVSVISVNGPEVTRILGADATGFQYSAYGRRCAYLADGALLAGFTLSAGRVDFHDTRVDDRKGGGVWCASPSATVSNCIITGNFSGGYGGGAYSGTLVNCVLSDNQAVNLFIGGIGDGGGAYASELKNCIITNNRVSFRGGGACTGSLINCLVANNSAKWGGGVADAALVNCTVVQNIVYSDGLAGGGGGGLGGGTAWNSIIVQNSGPTGLDNFISAAVSFSCTFPDPGGTGNITNDPAFVDTSRGDYRLPANSPCLNVGTNGTFLIEVDLDGRPRLVDDAVDMGAYEAQHHPWVVIGPAHQQAISGSNAWFSVTTVGDNLAFQWQKDGVNLTDDGRTTGAATPTLAISAVSTQDAGGYQVIIGNALGSATSTVATLTVLLPPAIMVAPASQTVAVGAIAEFSSVASGTEPLSYQWRKNGFNLANGGDLSGATSPALQVIGADTTDVGAYQVVVANPYGMVTSAVATLSLFPLAITLQPLSQSASASANVTFTIGASGTAAISYQWRFAQTNLTGQTNASLVITNVQSWNDGEYDVVVTNLYSALTSAVAVLTVLPALPTITTQPVSQVVSVGQSVSFQVAAKGSEPLSCLWQRDGTDLLGANALTLTLNNVNASFNGAYRAILSNSIGIAYSSNASLVVSPVLAWGRTNDGQLLASAVIPAAATNVIAIAAGPTTDLGLPCMALRADGTIVTWGYFSRDPAPPTNAVDVVAISVGSYGASANNLVLRADGTIVHWPVPKPPLPVVPPNSNFVAVAAGGSHQVALRDDGSVVAWGSNNYGQTNVPTEATNVVAIAAGANHSLALRADGAVVGWGLNASGQITALSNVFNVAAIAAGGNQSLALLADGSAAGRIVTNHTATALLYGPPPADSTNLVAISAGIYHTLGIRADLKVIGWGQTNYGQLNIPPYSSNALAVAAGGRLSLALLLDPFAPPVPPRITRSPVSRTVMAGQSVVFNALAAGAPPLRYAWFHDGALLTGQTNVWLALSNVARSDAGNYELVATNEFGSATSAVAQVTVAVPPPQLGALSWGDGGFSFSFQSVRGLLYVLEYKNDLNTSTWTEAERRFGVGGPELLTITAPGEGMRIYRVKVE